MTTRSRSRTANPAKPKGAAGNGVVTSAPRPTGAKAQMTTVTPALAEEWLGRNSHNRALRQRRVDDLVGAIERGEWLFNGDAIRFAKDGTLLDGQHRLWAVVLSERPIDTLVITGLEPESQETVDLGAKRNLRDALVLRGEQNAIKMSAAVNYWWRYVNGFVRVQGSVPTVAQGVATLEENPGLREAARNAERYRTKFRVSAAMMSAAIYELSSIDSEMADAFFGQLLSGEDLHAGDPIYALRRYFEGLNHGEASASVRGGTKGAAYFVHAIIIKAWNAYRDGRQVDKLNWKASGMKAEGFPEPY